MSTSTPDNHDLRRVAPREPMPERLVEIKPPQTYAHALRALNHLPNLETAKPGTLSATDYKLARMHALMSQLGDPHRSLYAVHVAGSKGKGSVAEMAAGAIAGCGCVVGLHTSPHLVDVRERIRVGGAMIDQDEFTRLLATILEAGAEIEPDCGTLTYFEATVAMAFLHFARQAVDVAVIEVGLGGRLDATNVITPAVSVITKIELEHTAILGGTHAAIAREKAGICKPGVPVVTLEQEPEAMEAIAAVADRIGAPLAVLGRDLDYSQRFEADADHGPHYRIGLAGPRMSFEHIAVPLAGEHQARNCGLVLGALDALADRGAPITELGVTRGLEAVKPLGRLEPVWDAPRIVVDGAHTSASIRALVETVGSYQRYDSMVVVFGCAGDKDTDGMLTEIARVADKVVFARCATSARAADPHKLAARFAELTGTMAQVELTVKDAVNTAARAVGGDDLILVTGSFYVAGEAKRLFDAKRGANAQGQAESVPG
ncbi:MAG: folylpolyglutamate synthase/dihydrofolate synthase family protein [Planctomycetota bacterium]